MKWRVKGGAQLRPNCGRYSRGAACSCWWLVNRFALRLAKLQLTAKIVCAHRPSRWMAFSFKPKISMSKLQKNFQLTETLFKQLGHLFARHRDGRTQKFHANRKSRTTAEKTLTAGCRVTFVWWTTIRRLNWKSTKCECEGFSSPSNNLALRRNAQIRTVPFRLGVSKSFFSSNTKIGFDFTLPLSTTRAAASSDCGMTPFSVPKVFTTDDTGDGTDIPCVFSARTRNMYVVAGFNSPTYTASVINTPRENFIHYFILD